MSVIGIVGSPRSGGNSETILDAVLSGAKASGKDVKKYNLNKMNIKGCQACMACKKNGVCIQKDDMIALLEDLKKADAVVMSTPVYWGQPNAQFRTFQDRCYSLIDMEFKPFIAPGKKLVTVVTAASGNGMDATVGAIEGAFSGPFGMVVAGTLTMGGGGPPNVAAGNKDILSKAEAIGKGL